MTTFLITGGAGFIGSHIAHSLHSLGYKIFVVDNLSTGDIQNLHPNFEFINLSCEDLSLDNSPWLHEIDHILHFAGQSSAELSFKDPIFDFNSNLRSTLNLLEIAISTNVTSFIYASSVTVYNKDQLLPLTESSLSFNSNSFYAISKSTSERYVSLYSSKLHTTSFRMFNIYGPAQNLNNPDQGMLSIYLAQALRSSNILVKGSLDRLRDFVHVSDVVDIAHRCLACTHPSGLSFNISTSHPTSVSQLLTLISLSLNKKLSITVSDPTPGDIFAHYGNSDFCTQLLGKQTYCSLEDGLRSTCNAYVNNEWFSTRFSFPLNI